MIQTYSGLAIAGIAAAVPKEVRELRKFAEQFKDMDVARLIKSTGIERVRVAGQDMTAADLCYAAAEDLLAELAIARSEIDALVFVSSTPDHTCPPTSHLLQHRLKLEVTTPCFDIGLGCAGYALGLLQASVLIASRSARKVLLLVGETATKIIDPQDRSTVVLFGDAGSATMIEARENSQITVCMNAEGGGAAAIFRPNSGMRKTEESTALLMNGLEVMNFAIQRVPQVIHSILDHVGLTKEDIDLFVFHQANHIILDFFIKKEKLDPDKVPLSLRNFGNTGGPSIPLTVVTDNVIPRSKRDKVLACGFGSGLSWGGALLDLSQTRILPLKEI